MALTSYDIRQIRRAHADACYAVFQIGLALEDGRSDLDRQLRCAIAGYDLQHAVEILKRADKRIGKRKQKEES